MKGRTAPLYKPARKKFKNSRSGPRSKSTGTELSGSTLCGNLEWIHQDSSIPREKYFQVDPVLTEMVNLCPGCISSHCLEGITCGNALHPPQMSSREKTSRSGRTKPENSARERKVLMFPSISHLILVSCFVFSHKDQKMFTLLSCPTPCQSQI